MCLVVRVTSAVPPLPVGAPSLIGEIEPRPPTVQDALGTGSSDQFRRGSWAGLRVLERVQSFRTPIFAWCFHSAVVLIAVILTVHFAPDRFANTGVWRYVVHPLSRWDGGWYSHVARSGYGEDKQAAAFWPLFPALMSAGHEATGLSVQTTGVILANLFFLGGLMSMYGLVRRIYGGTLATRATWIAALSPLSFFFSAVYTESLFLFLTTGAVLLAHSRRWTSAALVAALATLTRNSGGLILIPLAILLIRDRGWNPKEWWATGVQLLAAGLSPVVFAIHLDRVQGDAFLTMRVQEEWGRYQAFPWESVAEAIHRMHRIYATGRHSCDPVLSSDSLRGCRDAFQWGANDLSNDLSFIFLVGCALVLPFALWRLRIWDSCYLLAGLLLPLFGPSTWDPLASYARYLIVLFPIYIVVAMLPGRRPLFVAVLLVGTIAMVGLLILFASRNFVA